MPNEFPIMLHCSICGTRHDEANYGKQKHSNNFSNDFLNVSNDFENKTLYVCD